MKREVWIVEMQNPGSAAWLPTVGIEISGGLRHCELKSWRKNLPDDRFRLVRYVPASHAARRASKGKP